MRGKQRAESRGPAGVPFISAVLSDGAPAPLEERGSQTAPSSGASKREDFVSGAS